MLRELVQRLDCSKWTWKGRLLTHFLLTVYFSIPFQLECKMGQHFYFFLTWQIILFKVFYEQLKVNGFATSLAVLGFKVASFWLIQIIIIIIFNTLITHTENTPKWFRLIVQTLHNALHSPPHTSTCMCQSSAVISFFCTAVHLRHERLL